MPNLPAIFARPKTTESDDSFSLPPPDYSPMKDYLSTMEKEGVHVEASKGMRDAYEMLRAEAGDRGFLYAGRFVPRGSTESLQDVLKRTPAAELETAGSTQFAINRPQTVMNVLRRAQNLAQAATTGAFSGLLTFAAREYAKEDPTFENRPTYKLIKMLSPELAEQFRRLLLRQAGR